MQKMRTRWGGAILSTSVEGSDEQIPTSLACLNTFLRTSNLGLANGVAPLNANKKISTEYLPSYTEIDYVPNEDIADLNGKNTWTSEQIYNYEDYDLTTEDVLNGVACGFKSARGLFNQLFVGDVVFPRKTEDKDSGMADEIGFYIWDDVNSKIAVRDDSGNITTAGYNTLTEYTKVASVTKDGGIVLKSSTQGSSKYFKLTVNDSGQLNIAEV